MLEKTPKVNTVVIPVEDSNKQSIDCKSGLLIHAAAILSVE